MSRDAMKWVLIVIGIPIICTLALKVFIAPMVN
jgi:hypothetical protein